ncbi:MAG: PIN domain-containing protein [Promethearchaeota archaeon]
MDGAPSLPNNSNSPLGIQVLLDTNFLLLPFQRHIDIYEEIPRLLGGQVQFLILPQILTELKWLETKGSTKNKTAAKSTMTLISRHCQIVEDLPSAIQDLDADSALLRWAQQTGAIVATNDGELRRKLANQGSRAIFLRKLAVLALSE